MVRHGSGASQEADMGLLDILSSIQGGGAQPAPTSASEGKSMSPIAKAMLALLAVYALKHTRMAGSPPTQPGQPSGGSTTGGGGGLGGSLGGSLGDLLGGVLGGGGRSAGTAGGGLGDLLRGPLGGILGGAGAGT